MPGQIPALSSTDESSDQVVVPMAETVILNKENNSLAIPGKQELSNIAALPANQMSTEPAISQQANIDNTVEATEIAQPVIPEIANSPVAAEPEIVLSFSEVCWVDIRDSTGSFKLINQIEPGTVKKLSGKGPYKMLIGNVKGTTLTINGEPFDLERYNKANVARFSLDPAAL